MLWEFSFSVFLVFFFFQAEDGIRDLVRSRGLGDVYKRQGPAGHSSDEYSVQSASRRAPRSCRSGPMPARSCSCLLYTSDAADDLLCVDLGGRRIIKKKKKINHHPTYTTYEVQQRHTRIPSL